jgi:chromosome segregation ATPase
MERQQALAEQEIKTLEFEIQSTETKLMGLKKRLAEVKSSLYTKETKWPTDIDWND